MSRGLVTRPLGHLKYALLTLRGRLLVGAGVLWGVLCITLLTYGWQAGYMLVEETNRQHLHYEAELIRNSIANQVDERFQALKGLAQDIPEPTRGALAAEQAKALMAYFESLALFDLDSRVMDTSWPTGEGRVGASFADRDYARFMHAFQRPHVSEPFVSRVSGRSMVMLLVPLHDAEGRYTGFLGGAIDINKSRLFEGFNRLRLGAEGHVTITTASGQRLYQPGQQQGVTELSDDILPALDRALYGWQGEAKGTTAAGEPALVAYRQVWSADWIVGVHLPRAQAEVPLIDGMQRISRYALWTMGLVLPFVVVLIWLALCSLARLAEQVTALRDQRRHVLDIPTRMPELRRIIDVINETEQARMTSLRDLSRREALLHFTLRASPQGMFVTDSLGQPTFINEAVYEAIGPSASEELDTWVDRIHPDDRASVEAAWMQSLSRQQEFTRQFRFRDHVDQLRWVDVHARMIHIDGEFVGAVGTIRDITQRRKDADQRRWEAEHDPLTGLLNRRGLVRRLEEALAEWQKAGTQASVMVFDLDNLKEANDQGGHALGDRMLQQVAATTRGVMRSNDPVARLGGDEFVVLLPGCSIERARTLAEMLCERIASDVIQQQGQYWKVTASIGVSGFRPDDRSIDAILDRADAASYRVKHSGRNNVALADG
ncbi:diguanylate cyclase [Halomonas halodenitrificans]|uniref:diguanylate cyclase n=1 Tax=Halomonas halodenitrificans TaxID=28252 RepID=UPI000688128E|nr:diguanylate cyclase [Halomonas halodenitrificans]